MIEQQFLHTLESTLTTLPKEEREDILQDIREYFANGRQDGKTEEDIAQELGSPETIGQELLRSSGSGLEPKLAHSSGEAEFERVHAKIENAALVLCPSSDDELHVDVRDKSYRQQLTTEIKDRTLYITFREEQTKWGLSNFGITSKNPTVVLQLPAKTYEELDCTTDNGRIEADSVKSESIRLKSENGRIRAQQLVVDKLLAESDNGRIDLESVDAAELIATSSNGRIEMNKITSTSVMATSDNGRIGLANISGTVTAKTGNGRIHLTTDHLERNIRLKTDNGSITVQTAREPENTAIQTKSDWGSISVFGEKTRNRLFGSGDHTLQLTTDNGSITVEKL
ncbi:DUF4097 family beta strand repeat-containing protein [Planococcus lenghuensis]|uniref:DUF4097 domain-containing protein n=1 Tax=Planococcus lenghuensis TaxID=2213202 RepID=A0A1Q2L3G5_9BACL|nr:DUF4097 family beta strand repeat-containing protein [Planococcus lenghuensis]AQQ54422.1 hypothetical protein B0X71_15820 [Planococcus lenghuensis]